MAKTTKKPTAKQLAARKKFAKMAKARAKAAKAKKPAAKKTAAKKTAAKKTNTYQTGTSNKLYDSRKKAQGPGKRVSVDGNVYYERRKNRSDMPGSLTGINSSVLDKYKKTTTDIEKLEKALNRNKETAKKFPYKTDFWKKHFTKQNAEIKKYITELKKHKQQLKKLL